MIVELCERFGVRRLALFGSAAKGTYDPARSDLDFVVDLGSYERGVGSRYLGFIVALEQLLDRHVDVVTVRSIQSPAFKDEVDATSKVIYETIGRPAAA
jgi:predicted nucleotidyltransferase